MASVPSTPNPGQPIDTAYINSIVESLISINDALASNGNAYIDNGVANTSSTIRTGNLIVSSRTITNSTVSNGKIFAVGDKTPSTTVSFNNSAFSKPPVVTATLLTEESSSAQFILTISAITTGGFNYSAYCVVAGKANYSLNFTAIGV
jgi:hypothetical protein